MVVVRRTTVRQLLVVALAEPPEDLSRCLRFPLSSKNLILYGKKGPSMLWEK